MTAAEQAHPLKQTLLPLALDIAVPLGTYYLLHTAFGVGTAAALGLSSVVPAARTIFAAVAKREANALAMLMLTVNLVAIVLTFVSGDARLMLAKDSAVSSMIALGILWSVRERQADDVRRAEAVRHQGRRAPDARRGTRCRPRATRSAPRRTCTA